MSDPDFFINEKYFTEITCFLTFNFFAMVGSMTASVLPWVRLKSEMSFKNINFLF
jgi:solute carrier family 29 (equilibrative nucleoside transporter), member 1/2/3